MKISLKLFAGVFLIFLVGGLLALRYVDTDITPRYREAVEEPLVDIANAFAETLAVSPHPSLTIEEMSKSLNARTIHAEIFGIVKDKIDLRFAVTDATGGLLYDSYDPSRAGTDYSQWRDISKTLKGEYGARTTRDVADDPASTVLYVAAPIIKSGAITGVVEIGKPTKNFNRFIERTKNKIIKSIAAVCAIGLLLVLALSSIIVTGPIKKLSIYARKIASGQPVLLPTLPKDELGDLGKAFEEMRKTIEGKRYVEEYVQTLTHELKSPLSGIRGALEILADVKDEKVRAKFLENIQTDASRMKHLVDRMLTLSSLESRNSLMELENFSLSSLVETVVNEIKENSGESSISLIAKVDRDVMLEGDRLLIGQAIRNLLENATAFASEKVEIMVQSKENGAVVKVLDDGPGIPDYALPRIFERFYSLPRPEGGKKSTGLGLCFVQQVLRLHNSLITVENRAEGGAIATLEFDA